MEKLTAEKCREQFEVWGASRRCELSKWVRGDKAGEYKNPVVEKMWQAWAAARQEIEVTFGQQNNLKHVGYLFVNPEGGVVYSPSGFGMKGFTCAGKIYGDVVFQPEQPTNQSGG